MWSTLDGTEHSLRKLAKSLNDQSSTADKEVLKSLAFVFIDDPDAAGERLYNFIPKIGTHLQAVKSNLESQLPDLNKPSNGSAGPSVFSDGSQYNQIQQIQ